MCKRSNRFPLHRNSVLVDLFVKRLAESNGVLVRGLGCAMHFEIGIEPHVHVVEEVKTREVKEPGSVPGWFGSKENRRGKYSLKPSDQSAIMWAVFGQVEEIEQLTGGMKVYCSSPLLHGERGHPYRNESVLPEWDGRFIMHSPQ